ncbi:MAG: fused MFS/spermidine synthase [Thermoanaerobaculia bacterium]|jgi:predicted membrane-bound spermidine synthase
MNSRTFGVSLLVVGSGFCALVYQTVWIRELRLVFGASTGATAAVLGVFMAGLGLGSHILGRRADRSDDPLRFYGHLEAGIAILAACSPLLVDLVSSAYFASGGRPALGGVGATLLRLALGCIVLGLPTFLMGGTLPALSRAVESNDDLSRRRLALLYGANTLGAVAGVVVSTFYLLESLGNRLTLWSASALNIVVALSAYTLAAIWTANRATAGEGGEDEDGGAHPAPADRRLARFVLVSAAIVGFVFLLMELVWYRMLGPLLGGTTFTFGLILAFALLGIGLGGLAYALTARGREATLYAFAMTCGLEALFMAIPYAAGDRLAVFALFSRIFGSLGLGGYVFSWSVVAAIVVLVPAIIAGYQFPLLISLLGKGREAVGSDVGRTYAWNTAGAIVGSIAGGFGLIPLLTAEGTWRVSIAVLVALSVWAALSSAARERSSRAVPIALVIAALSVGAILAKGPTAAWRHSPIGAGRASIEPADPNGVRSWLNARRRAVVWSADGVESSVGLQADDGYAFSINGKIDGHSRFDAPTQVMAALVGAFLHPEPKTAMVVGLGTGSSAGWLGAIPSMERVDVSELEPAILKIAEACAPVNHGVLKNPKVHITIGDAREHLLAGKGMYDVIASEPSNPYRAGIASLFTIDFYRAVSKRLSPNGVFVQWVQAYEVDASTIRSIYASYAQVFPRIETWETQNGDLLLIGSLGPLRYDADILRARLREEPYRSAAANVWRVDSLEGVLAHYVAGTTTARALAAGAIPNTDDRTVVEFGFARALGRRALFDPAEIKQLAIRLKDDVPALDSGVVDRDRLAVERMSMVSYFNNTPVLEPSYSQEQLVRLNMHASFGSNAYQNVLVGWRIVGVKEPGSPIERRVVAESYAEIADAVSAEPMIAQIRQEQPIEADVIEARLRRSERRYTLAADALERAFIAYRSDPWPGQAIMGRSLDLAIQIGEWDPDKQTASRLFEALDVDFSAALYRQRRYFTRYVLSTMFDPECTQPRSLAAVRAFEPELYWERDYLERRANCYAKAGDKAAAMRAKADVETYDRNRVVTLSEMMKDVQ